MIFPLSLKIPSPSFFRTCCQIKKNDRPSCLRLQDNQSFVLQNEAKTKASSALQMLLLLLFLILLTCFFTKESRVRSNLNTKMQVGGGDSARIRSKVLLRNGRTKKSVHREKKVNENRFESQVLLSTSLRPRPRERAAASNSLSHRI